MYKIFTGAVSFAALNFSIPFAQANKPNVIVYITDDQSRNDASVYGAPSLLQTPNLDILAKDGLVFNNAFIASPASAPSRAALLTALMPARNGAEANHSYPKSTDLYILGNLQRIGYEVSAFGKVAHEQSKPEMGFNYYKNVAQRGDLYGEVSKYYTTVSDKSKPQCIMVGDRRPHVPWIRKSIYDAEQVTLPGYFIDTKETREFWGRYLTDITGVDNELGKVYQWAKGTFGDNFIFIYTSDHGGQWPFGKWNLYDAGIRVPLIISSPIIVKPGTRTDAMVSWIDILPTIFDVVGATIPENIDGNSFRKVLEGKSGKHREWIFTTHSGDGKMNVYPIRSVRNHKFKYILNLYPENYHSNHSDILRKEDAGAYWNSWDEAAAVDPRAKAIIRKYYIRPAEEFYCLTNDPDEQVNLINDKKYAGQIRLMRKKLEKWMEEQGDQKTLFEKPYPVSVPRPGNTDIIQ